MATPINTPISHDPAARLAEQQSWITPVAQVRAQTMIADVLDALGGEGLRTALHGDWLNEPLHAVLTDVPVGRGRRRRRSTHWERWRGAGRSTWRRMRRWRWGWWVRWARRLPG